MTRYLHSLTAFLFYALGLSGFGAFVLLRNSIADPWPGWWLEVVKLPIVITGLLYGGTSIYRSLTLDGAHPSRTLGVVIVLPVLALIALSIAINFSDLFPLPF